MPDCQELDVTTSAIVAVEAVTPRRNVVGGHVVNEVLQDFGLAVVDLNYVCPVGYWEDKIAFIVVLEPIGVVLREHAVPGGMVTTRSTMISPHAEAVCGVIHEGDLRSAWYPGQDRLRTISDAVRAAQAAFAVDFYNSLNGHKVNEVDAISLRSGRRFDKWPMCLRGEVTHEDLVEDSIARPERRATALLRRAAGVSPGNMSNARALSGRCSARGRRHRCGM